MSTRHDRVHRHRKVVVATLAIVGALAVMPAASAHHDEGPAPQARGRAESLATDAAIVAADTGWSGKAVLRHLDDQHAFGEVVEAVEAGFPDTFAGAEFAAVPNADSHLRFTGAVPPGARAIAEKADLPITLTGGRTYSQQQLRDRSVDVVRFFADAGYPQVGSAVMPDGLIDVAVTGKRKPGVELPTELRDGVRVTHRDHQVVDNEHTYGGARVRNTNTGASCTSGFSVEDLWSNDTGASTAAHCGGMNEYQQPGTVPLVTYNFPFQAQHEGLFGDVEWHTAVGHGEFAEFWANAPVPGNPPTGDLREVNSIEGTISVNNTYCVYSRMRSSRTCDQVYSDFVNSFTFSGGLVSSLVGMDDDNTDGGDSGGPWSLSTEAAGGHRGDQWIWFGTRNVWSRANLFPVALGVSVMTQ